MLQIENRVDEYNPYAHSPQDNIAHMNLAYWEEQMKATIAATAFLAVPVTNVAPVYLPVMADSYGGSAELGPANTTAPDHSGCPSWSEKNEK